MIITQHIESDVRTCTANIKPANGVRIVNVSFKHEHKRDRMYPVTLVYVVFNYERTTWSVRTYIDHGVYKERTAHTLRYVCGVIQRAVNEIPDRKRAL